MPFLNNEVVSGADVADEDEKREDGKASEKHAASAHPSVLPRLNSVSSETTHVWGEPCIIVRLADQRLPLTADLRPARQRSVRTFTAKFLSATPRI